MRNKAVKRMIVIAVWLALFAARSDSAHHRVRDQVCSERNGITEFNLGNGARADCVTATELIEIDHARDWADGLGQILRYSALIPERQMVMVLIVARPDEGRFVRAARQAIGHHRLPVSVEAINI